MRRLLAVLVVLEVLTLAAMNQANTVRGFADLNNVSWILCLLILVAAPPAIFERGKS
jgi:hypothetical protein